MKRRQRIARGPKPASREVGARRSRSSGAPGHARAGRRVSVLVLGVGSFAHSTAQILAQDGAKVSTYLTRNYGHYAPSLAGPTYSREQFPSPCPLLDEAGVDLVVPMSIDWAQAPWAGELLARKIPILCPTGEGLRIERERDRARRLCQDFRVPFPEAHMARNRLEAEAILQRHPLPFVIKNPLCSPTSPIHTHRLRVGGGHPFLAPPHRLCRRRVPAGIPGPLRGGPHRPGQPAGRFVPW